MQLALYDLPDDYFARSSRASSSDQRRRLTRDDPLSRSGAADDPRGRRHGCNREEISPASGSAARDAAARRRLTDSIEQRRRPGGDQIGCLIVLEIE